MGAFDDLIPQEQNKPQSLFGDLVPSDKGEIDTRIDPFASGTRSELSQMKETGMADQAAVNLEESWKGNAEFPELPHIADTEVFNKNQNWLADAKNVFRSPDSLAQSFLQQANKGAKGREPQYRKGKDSSGNMIIEKRGAKDYEPFAYINTSGMDWRDVRDTAVQTAPYIAAGMLSGGFTAGMPWLFRAGSMVASEEATLFATKGFAGEKVSEADMWLTGLTAPLGVTGLNKVAGKAFVGEAFSTKQMDAARILAQKSGVKTPTEHTINLFAQREAGQISKKYSDMSLITAGETGMPLSKADMMPETTQAERLAKGKQRAKEAGLSDVAEMSENVNEQAIKQREFIEGKRDLANASRPEAQTGNEFIELVGGQARSEKAAAEQLYSVRPFASTQQVPTGSPVTTVGAVPSHQGVRAGLVTKVEPNAEILDLRARLKAVGKTHRLDLQSNKDTFKKSRKYMTNLNKDLDDMVARGKWSIGEVDDIYRSINNQITNAKRSSDKKVLGEIKETYRDWVEKKLIPTLKPEESDSMRQLFNASDAYGEYIRKWGKDDAVGKIVSDIANGKADPELVIPALFGGETIDITAKQASHIVDLLPREKQAAMQDIMREGIFRRIFASPKTGRTKEAASDVLKELDALIGSGGRTDLGNYLFRSGSKTREDLYTIRNIMELISNDDKMKQQATGQALSALYARINTPFGFRVVTALPDWHARAFRGRRARRMLDPLRPDLKSDALGGGVAGGIISQNVGGEE
ncbi:MAG: hypothetical protein J7K75_03020 [Desulfuromonas sp.]|nr:hypothetical protein [Desulfuromonas sp.]